MALQIPQALPATYVFNQDGTAVYMFVKNTFVEVKDIPAGSLDEKSPTNRRSRSEPSHAFMPGKTKLRMSGLGSEASSSTEWTSLAKPESGHFGMDSGMLQGPVKRVAADFYFGMNAGRGSAAALVGVGQHGEAMRDVRRPAAAVHGDSESNLRANSPARGFSKNDKGQTDISDDDKTAREETSQSDVPYGSRGHASGACKPCAHYWRPGGCSKGDLCSRCHICDESRVREYRLGYRRFVRNRRSAGSNNSTQAQAYR